MSPHMRPICYQKSPYTQIGPICHQIMMADRDNVIVPMCHQEFPRSLQMRRIDDEQRDAHEIHTRCTRHAMRCIYHQKTSATHLMSQEPYPTSPNPYLPSYIPHMPSNEPYTPSTLSCDMTPSGAACLIHM